MARQAAFFDVDGTLTRTPTIFRFLDHYRASGALSHRRYAATLARVSRLRAAGAPREHTNRAFYRCFAGAPVAAVRAEGERWFAAALAAGGDFRPATVARLQHHLAAGDLVVLLSGSFAPCLDPLARFLGAHLSRGTELAVTAGRYTGEVVTAMVGRHKAAAAQRIARAHQLDLATCTAYGDDPSDLDLLTLVGRPVAVGDDRVLAEHARRRRWHRLPDRTVDPPPPRDVAAPLP